MDIEPNRVVQTSADTFDDTGNKFIRRYPIARAPTDIIAIAASPLILVFCPVFNNRIAANTVIGSTINISLVKPAIAAIAMAPNAT